MNASPISPASAATSRPAAPSLTRRRPWVFSLTGVCFVFGALLAMQIRAIQQVETNRIKKTQGIAEANQLASKMKAEAVTSAKERAELNRRMIVLQDELKKRGSLTVTQVALLNSQIKDLQTVAGLTSINGPGIRITLSDNPNAAKTATDTAFLPGLVHDYDILQVVNELRAAKADAIAVRGAGAPAIRVTGYTPIRCVGPAILVNWEPVAAPFTIEVVGDVGTLRSALEMPNGIVDQLKNNGAIGVKITSANDIALPPSSNGAPKLRVAKSIS